MYKKLANHFIKMNSNYSKKKIKNILVLGLTFKENTNDLRNSKIFDLCKYLNSKGYKVSVYDPLVNIKIKNKNFNFYNKINFKKKFKSVFFAVPHKKILINFNKLNFLLDKKAMIFDLKNVLNQKKIRSDLKVINF